MTDKRMLPPPSGPALPSAAVARPGPRAGSAVLAALVIIAGSALIGLLGGMLWAAAAPRVVYQVYTLNPPTAYAVNPETSSFIAADGLYCFIAVGGGALIGLLSYLLAVRRYGPLPMAGVVIGSTAAAFIAAWAGHQQSGGAGFDHVLATSKPGTLLRAPITLGAHGALAFWPLAAAVVAGGIELLSVLRARHQSAYSGVPMPGIESFGVRQYPARPSPGEPASPDERGNPGEPPG